MPTLLSARPPRCRFWDDTSACRRAIAKIAPGETQVWFAEVPADEEEIARLLPLLEPSERRRGDRIARGEPRRRFLAGRQFLRRLLGLRLGKDRVRIETGPGGKPHLADPHEAAACRFNLAHGSGWLAVALAVDREVGVDLEPLAIPGDWRAIARAVCSEGETQALAALPARERKRAFLRAWTRKEAVLKAAGVGLAGAVSPAVVEVVPERPVVCCPSAEWDICRWGIAEISSLPGHCGALAWGIPSETTHLPFPAGADYSRFSRATSAGRSIFWS